MYKYLDQINSYEDYRAFDDANVKMLAREIRHFLITNVSKTGGHLASNLGVVELTLALAKVFDFNKDKIIFDVGHQAYVYKILTGRKKEFAKLRQLGGISGFPKRSESKYDFFNTGHSGTSISGAIGMAKARKMRHKNYNIIALIGDASLGNGLALEGLNFLASSKDNVLIILNDNGMSISKNVGAIAKLLSGVRLTEKYRSLSKKVKETLGSIPYIGDRAVIAVKDVKDIIKNSVVSGDVINRLGINYFGPIDGHNYNQIKNALIILSQIEGPKLLHLKTVKGKGYKLAEENPGAYHGVGKFDPTKPLPASSRSFSAVAGEALGNVLKSDDKMLVITPAMLSGTGIKSLKEKYPENVIDVGIEESNAVTIAAGAAASGIKSYAVTYSSFFQRAYDQILHDVCLQNLPVTFLIDRAGIVGADGETHNGIYDLSYLIHMPNMQIFSPKDSEELSYLIQETHKLQTPVAIRYPKSGAYVLDKADITFEDVHRWEIYGDLQDRESINLAANARMVKTALEVRKILKDNHIKSNVVNVRAIKPIDEDAVEQLLSSKLICSIEDNVIIGGFSSYLLMNMQKKGFNGKFMALGFPDKPIEQGSAEKLFEKYGLDSASIASQIIESVKTL